jgi:hypothetical protein
MASGWFLDGLHPNPWADAGAGCPVQIKQLTGLKEHAAHFRHPDEFDSLLRKNHFLAEGVHTVFGVKGGEAEIQGCYFPANLFTPVEAKRWLRDRQLDPLVFTEATEATKGKK